MTAASDHDSLIAIPDDEPLTLIRIALARIEERQEAAVEKSKSIEQKLDGLVTKASFEALAARVKVIENTQAWIMRSIVTAAVGAIASLYAWGHGKIGAP